MAELTPFPFRELASRMFRELEQQQAIFDLPESRFVLGADDLDLAVDFHSHRASSALGPAAGPHSQMAQNLVLSWLAGCRIMELKTVQIKDELEIPRPCIDIRTVGFNAEWSQELKLEQSLDEYVKGAMLIKMLQASGKLAVAETFGDVVYDMSVGYDLEGIRSERVLEFIHGMMDAGAVVERMRPEIPEDFAHLRDLDFATRLSDTITLSTFHGCPPDEIERIIDFLLRELGIHSIVKFNPMLLGPNEARALVHDELGYRDIRVPDSAFERDTTWDQAVEMVERLGETASSLGLGFGVKFSNTLIVENIHGFLPDSVPEVYLSGPPLHVLAMHLVRRFRRTFGDRFPISFAAGVDRFNYPDAIALGLVPITVCTDLLKKGGYGRLHGYSDQLRSRMEAVRARNVSDFILTAYGQGLEALEDLDLAPDNPIVETCRKALAQGDDLRQAAGDELHRRWVSKAILLNTEHYVSALTSEPRYGQERNCRPPRKIGSHLELFDCVTCDICVPVCPNDANFTFTTDCREVPIVKLQRHADGWNWHREGALPLAERHQIGNLADFCNDCGNCDVFCPEDGGPYVMKPRFFRRRDDWGSSDHLDGFHLERQTSREVVLGRFNGAEYRLEARDGKLIYSGDGFEISFDEERPEQTVAGDGPEEVDLTYAFIMDTLRRAIFDPKHVNYINILEVSGDIGA